MKNLLGLLSATLLVFTSCSKDDNNESSDPASPILVKKITTIDSKGNSSSESYLYNGNKIVSVTQEDGSVTKYNYTGDLITKIEKFDSTGALNLITNYIYIEGKLDSSIDNYSNNNKYYYKIKYTHNQDETISYEQFTGVVSTGIEEKYGPTGKYTYKNENVVKLEVSYSGGESLYTYEYDAKNNPFKNVLGYYNLFLEDVYANNVIKEISNSEKVYTYKYNENNYPTEKVTNFSGSNDTEIIQYVY